MLSRSTILEGAGKSACRTCHLLRARLGCNRKLCSCLNVSSVPQNLTAMQYRCERTNDFHEQKRLDELKTSIVLYRYYPT